MPLDWPAEGKQPVTTRAHRAPWPWLLLAGLLLALAALRAVAAPAEPLIARAPGDAAGVYWIDTTGVATLAQAQAAFASGAGRPADMDAVMPIGPSSAIWYRLQMPPVPQPLRAVLRIAFPGTDHVDLYRPVDGGQWQRMRSGDHVPVVDWPLRNIDPSFMFTIEPGERPTFMRVENAQPIRVRWTLQDARSFFESLKLWHFALGAYGGFIAMVVLLSLFNAVSWRDPIHLYYAVHVVMVALSIVALTGVGNEYLWPDSPRWADAAPVVIPGLAMAWFGLFVRELVVERGGRLLSWLLIGHFVVGVLMVVLFLILGREHVYRAPSVYAVPALLMVLFVVGWYTLRRPKVGLWVLGGMLMLVAGALLPLLQNLGVLETSFLTESGTQLGAALEIPLLLVGLYFRSRERRANRLRLEQMATTDPLTGLANHRVLFRRLEQLLKAARRDRSLGAVYRVHVANLADITSEHGREAGEAALMRAAECVAKDAREGDLVARDPGSDVLLVLGGRITQHAAAAMGRDIIARGLKYSPRLPRDVTLKLRVAAACAPLPEAMPADLVQSLGRLLLDMENDERHRWLRFLGSPDASTWYRTPSMPRESELPAAPPSREELASLAASRPSSQATPAK